MNKAQEMDFLLWGLAAPVASYWKRNFTKPWELDFVRALHEQPGLQQLCTWLGQQSGQSIRMHSIWLDKHAWVEWNKPTNPKQRVGPCELADLAVVIRKNVNGAIHRWLWILQAKRTPKAFANYSGDSSTREIELLQQMPPFDLGGCLSGTFNLQPEFTQRCSLQSGSPWPIPQIPWTFLDFDKAPADSSSAASQIGSPIAARWPAIATVPTSWAGTHPQVNPALGSYTGCLLDLLTGGKNTVWKEESGALGHPILPGGPVGDPGYKEWTRLYIELMGLSRNNGHAASPNNANGKVHTASQFYLSKFSELFYYDYDYDYYGYFSRRYFKNFSVALSEPYTERMERIISRFDELEIDALRHLSDYGDGGGLIDDGARPPSDDQGGGPAVTLFIDVLGPSDSKASERMD